MKKEEMNLIQKKILLFEEKLKSLRLSYNESIRSNSINILMEFESNSIFGICITSLELLDMLKLTKQSQLDFLKILDSKEKNIFSLIDFYNNSELIHFLKKLLLNNIKQVIHFTEYRVKMIENNKKTIKPQAFNKTSKKCISLIDNIKKKVKNEIITPLDNNDPTDSDPDIIVV